MRFDTWLFLWWFWHLLKWFSSWWLQIKLFCCHGVQLCKVPYFSWSSLVNMFSCWNSVFKLIIIVVMSTHVAEWVWVVHAQSEKTMAVERCLVGRDTRSHSLRKSGQIHISRECNSTRASTERILPRRQCLHPASPPNSWYESLFKRARTES